MSYTILFLNKWKHFTGSLFVIFVLMKATFRTNNSQILLCNKQTFDIEPIEAIVLPSAVRNLDFQCT